MSALRFPPRGGLSAMSHALQKLPLMSPSELV